jgi:hypothetical protein
MSEDNSFQEMNKNELLNHFLNRPRTAYNNFKKKNSVTASNSRLSLNRNGPLNN